MQQKCNEIAKHNELKCYKKYFVSYRRYVMLEFLNFSLRYQTSLSIQTNTILNIEHYITNRTYTVESILTAYLTAHKLWKTP